MRSKPTSKVEMEILQKAAGLERRQQATRDSESAVHALCMRWGDAVGLWGVSPTDLRRACEASGLLTGEKQS
jgi:hypothetical protein